MLRRFQALIRRCLVEAAREDVEVSYTLLFLGICLPWAGHTERRRVIVVYRIREANLAQRTRGWPMRSTISALVCVRGVD